VIDIKCEAVLILVEFLNSCLSQILVNTATVHFHDYMLDSIASIQRYDAELYYG